MFCLSFSWLSMGWGLIARAVQELSMPALSPTMSQGNLASWAVEEGAEIAAGDVLAEIETDKATLTWDMQVRVQAQSTALVRTIRML